MSTNHTHNQTTVMPPNTAQKHHTGSQAPWARSGKVGLLVLTATLALLSLWATSAFADYEQASEHFGTTGEAAQLEDVVAIAINTTGAGGVEPGSIYAVGLNGRVVRYGPGKEGEEPPFKEAWGWGVGNEGNEYQRCGPALTDDPAQHTFSTCTPSPVITPFGGEEAGDFESPTAVAVDQATGDVYIRNSDSGGNHRLRNLIEVFTATGSPVGDGFGDQGRQSPEPAESISEGPEKLHRYPGGFEFEGLAVNEVGVVYVTDVDFLDIANPTMGEARIMSFAPEHDGDYEHYVYTGASKDISAPVNSLGGNDLFSRIALTGSDGLVATNGESILQYGAGNSSVPVCTYLLAGAKVEALTVNPVTGEVFFFNHADGKLHSLGACDSETGQFAIAQTPISPTPTTRKMFALAVNPVLSWGLARPEGVVYSVEHEKLRSNGDVFVPAKSFPPSIRGESVVGTTMDSSVLRAEVNPNGFATAYRFQYLPAVSYLARASQAEGEGKAGSEVEDAAFVGASEVPSGQGGVLPAGGVGVAAASVTGLLADTEYRFRVVVSSGCVGKSQPACVAVGGVDAFGTYPFVSAGLPDGRVYELVSPPEKHGGEVFPADPRVGSCEDCKPPSRAVLERFPMQSSPNGDGVVYMGYPFTTSEGAVFNEYLSQRTDSGWQTTDMSPALQATQGSGSLVFNTGLGRDLLYQVSPQLSVTAPVGYANLYLQEASAPGTLTPLIAGVPPNRPGVGFRLEFGGASPDLSQAFFSANDALTGTTLFAPEAADPGVAGRDLYEWHEGALVLVNVLPGNAGVAAGAVFASARGQGVLSADEHGVSTDGSRVFWSADGHLYVRVNGQETQEVSDGAGFETASANGLEVLLSNGAIARYNGETGVYEQAADITESEGGFQGILGTGEEDGLFSRVYFVDTQVLSGAGENERGQSARSGQDNLYVWEADAPKFIVTLDARDETGGGNGNLKDWSAVPVGRTAEASPDGRWLAFGSKSSLTGYDSQGSCELTLGVWSEGACSEVFIYNAVSGSLVCASCNPTGEAPRGSSALRVVNGAASENGTNLEWFSQPHYLTDSGRLLFDSGDRLSAFDSNGRVEDVYEYEPDGVGTCSRRAGCVLLISPGTGSVDSNFLAMDETGKNVFFTTRERLVPQDKDELIDLYDAREQGGFSSQTETQHAECQGEACQSTPTPPPFTTPGSTTFAGAGNLVQPIVTVTAPRQRKATSSNGQRAKALSKCRRQRSKRKRTACEKKARKSTRRPVNAHPGSREARR